MDIELIADSVINVLAKKKYSHVEMKKLVQPSYEFAYENVVGDLDIGNDTYFVKNLMADYIIYEILKKVEDRNVFNNGGTTRIYTNGKDKNLTTHPSFNSVKDIRKEQRAVMNEVRKILKDYKESVDFGNLENAVMEKLGETLNNKIEEDTVNEDILNDMELIEELEQGNGDGNV